MESIYDIIKSEIPIGFFQEWLLSLDLAYEEATTIVERNFEPPEAHNLLPYIYNARAEVHLRRIASKYSCLTIEQAQIDNGYYFVKLKTDSIIITQKSVQSPGSMVEPSPTRKSLAQGNAKYCDDNTMPLFAIDPMTKDKSSNRIYGILTHNRASVYANDGEPFANLAFPDPQFKYYIANVSIHDHVFASYTLGVISTPVVEIQDEAIPKLKFGISKEKIR